MTCEITNLEMVIYTNIPVLYKLPPICEKDLLPVSIPSHRQQFRATFFILKKMSKDSENCTKYITYDQIPLKIKQRIDEIVKREGYLSNKIKCEMTSTEGGNFTSFLYEVNIKGETDDGDKDTDIFVKHIMTLKNTEMIEPSTAFQREAHFYSVIAEVFKQLQEDANIPLEDRYQFIKHYYADSELTIMENASKRGFKTLNRMDVVPLNVAEKVIQNLAKFHALSFILENKHPEFYETNIKKLNTLLQFNESWLKFANNMVDIVTNVLSGETRHKIKKIMPSIIEEFSAHMNPNNTLKSCLCHGDYRLNNILLNNKTSTVLPIDYQLINYNNPVKDFIYFIISSTDQEFRREDLDSLKEIYHHSLSEFLAKFDLDVKKIYPRDEFERAYEKYLEYGLLTSVMMLPIIFVREDDVPELGDTDAIFNLHDMEFKERIQGLADDFIDWLDL